MEAANLYSNNADVKFPLIDTHEADIPNSILIGLSLSVPEGNIPVLTGLRVGISYVFAVFEDLNTGAAIADVRVDDPVPGLIYPLEMSVEGSGFISFGPGIYDEVGYFSGQVSVALETEVVNSLTAPANSWTFNVNSLDYDISNVLSLLSANDLVTISVEDNKIYIDRNDAVVTAVDRLSFIVRSGIVGEDPRVFSISNVLPDINGNIDIDVEGCIERCTDVNSLALDRGDSGAGDHISLPLDIFFPAKTNPADPCAPSNSSSSAGTEDEDICVNVYKQTILDEQARAVGTLYTHIVQEEIAEILYDSGLDVPIDPTKSPVSLTDSQFEAVTHLTDLQGI